MTGDEIECRPLVTSNRSLRMGCQSQDLKASGKADCSRQTSDASCLPEESVGHGQTNLGVPPRAISPLASCSGLVVCPSLHEPGTHVGAAAPQG